jgi:diguanylate cyclase (GGDEF)-like protein/PAS domain S-box-containing protein
MARNYSNRFHHSAAAGDSVSKYFDAEVNCALVEHMPSGVVYCKMIYCDSQPNDFIFLYTNPAFETLSGLKQVKGKPVSKVIPGIQDQAPLVFETYRRVAMGGGPERFETFVGSLGILFSVSVYSPKQEHFVAVFDVITEHKQAEESVRQSEALYRKLFKSNPHPMWIYDLETLNVLAVNDAAISHYGYSEAEFLSMTIADIWPSEDRPKLINNIQYLEVDALHETGFCRHIKKDGTLIDVEIASNRLEYAGRLTEVMLAHDFTRRKQAEIDLRISAIAFEAQEGILVTDADSVILRVNHAFTAITGYSAEDVIGRNPRLLSSGQQDTDFYAAMWDSLHNTGSWEGEIWNRRKNGDIYPEHLTITSVKDSRGNVTNYVATLTDVTLKKEADDKIKHMAYYDPLTGLSNRRLMIDRLSQQLAHARRSGDLVAICMLDLDGFKHVNDQLGHKAGDALLVEVAKRLQECVRQSDTVSRFGGDEFSLVLGDVKKISECEQTIYRIIARLAMPYQIDGNIAHVTASIGATIFPNDGDTPDLLLRHADQAMYEAKEAGKNCYCLFNPSHHKQQMSNKAMLDKMSKALVDGQFTMFYQPQVDCRLGKVTGVEALIRWNHPILGLLPPSEFMPLLEHDNLIITVGEWVIDEALRQLAEWKKAGIALNISVNVAARQLHQERFVSRLKALLVNYDSDVTNRLIIEIVETTALEDITLVSETIRQCRELNIQFAIDDFGTGFSSLAHLKHLRVSELKIDKSFVFNMLKNPEDLAIVSGVIGLGASFKHEVIAEGVESIDQILMLMDLGCNIMQGYVIARPMTATQLVSWLKEFEPDPLWKLPFSQATSRDYFELLLAETHHRHWINELTKGHDNSQEDFNSREFLDSKQCRFGHWLYGDGTRQFGKERWFLSIESIHQGIHESALRLCEFQRDGNLLKAADEASYLQEQQNLLNDNLKNAREALSNQYLTANLNKSL